MSPVCAARVILGRHGCPARQLPGSWLPTGGFERDVGGLRDAAAL